MQLTIDEEGETRVRDRFVVSASVSGRLERIELEPGDPASKGAVVARLVPADAPLLDVVTAPVGSLFRSGAGGRCSS